MKISEASTLSIGIVAGLIVAVVSSVLFIGGLAYSSAQHDKDIAEIKTLIEERRKARAQYEQTVALQIAGLKADVSIVDTRMTYLTEVVLKALEQGASSGAKRKGVHP
jgi:hypothetical protein